MQANELRINNYIQDSEGCIMQVLGITNPDENGNRKIVYKSDEELSMFEIKFSNGIPLTPEVLERCELENIYGFHVTYNKDSYEKLGKAVYWFQRKEGYGESVTKQVVYLHQLQNLYYAHSDCELEIKELQQTEK